MMGVAVYFSCAWDWGVFIFDCKGRGGSRRNIGFEKTMTRTGKGM